MADKIRWGLISTARINDALVEPIQQAARSELRAVASRSLEKGQAYAAERQIPIAYGSYEELLADPEIDAVYVSLPNAQHCEWTVKAADAGKHVLCEKPLVINLDELGQVESAAKRNNVTIFEAFMYLHHPQTRKAIELIESGKLGTVQQVNSWFHFYLAPENSSNIRLIRDLSGGSLWDVGVYPNSLSIVMTGGQPPVEVYGHQIIGESGVDVAMRGQLLFADGAVAQISSGFRTPFREGTFVVGDKGMLTIPEPWKPGIKGKDSLMTFTAIDGKEEQYTTPAINPYVCEVQAMEACILDGAAPVVPLSLSRAFLLSALALYASASHNAPVRISATAGTAY
jgi:D-xylose 1-dehydrogenase (NADP+, D-xylono-1,5-lactone-forming)